MRTLNVEQAALFLGMHRVTVLEKARAGIIPGAKPGKRWTFVEDDLVAYLRGLYPCNRQALQGDRKDERLCHSTNAKAHRTGGFALPSTDAEYKKALRLPTA
jgi:excisionase family DNA binding protein